VPVLRQAVLDATPAIADLLDDWMAKLTQEALTDLNKQVSVDQKDPKDVVEAWLAANGLTSGTAGSGTTIKVGSTNFYEQEILGELFAQVLEADGFKIDRKFQLGNREIVFPALEAGEIDILAEYAATALEFVNSGAGEASTDPAATVAKLKERLAPKGLTALDPAPATDQNGFVVTKATAEKYGISKLSDLAKPAP
jgi:osmoprotectant transport system substrate-binding protein